MNHSSFLLTRFQAGVDGKIAYQKLKGKTDKKPMFMFTEHVLYLPIGTRYQKLNKLLPKWEDGIFLGLKDSSNEYFIGTDKGVLKASSIKRVPESERFEQARLENMIGMPWCMVPDTDSDQPQALPATVDIPVSTMSLLRLQVQSRLNQCQDIYQKARTAYIWCDTLRVRNKTTLLQSDACTERMEIVILAYEFEQTRARLETRVAGRDEYIEKRLTEDIQGQQANKAKTAAGSGDSGVAVSPPASSRRSVWGAGGDAAMLGPSAAQSSTKDKKRRRLLFQAAPQPNVVPSQSQTNPKSAISQIQTLPSASWTRPTKFLSQEMMALTCSPFVIF